MRQYNPTPLKNEGESRDIDFLERKFDFNYVFKYMMALITGDNLKTENTQEVFRKLMDAVKTAGGIYEKRRCKYHYGYIAYEEKQNRIIIGNGTKFVLVFYIR